MQRFLFKTVPCSEEIGIKIEMLDKQVRVRKQEISDEMCTPTYEYSEKYRDTQSETKSNLKSQYKLKCYNDKEIHSAHR